MYTVSSVTWKWNERECSVEWIKRRVWIHCAFYKGSQSEDRIDKQNQCVQTKQKLSQYKCFGFTLP
ncbi:histone lysine set [Sesbania bispinosa]|nr:histone lysine set [Sesbania bispinosa]